MTEKLSINGRDIWITVDPHLHGAQGSNAEEYFTATYHAIEPSPGSSGVVIEENGRPKLFASPVEAIEYASEKLLGIIAP